MATSTPTSCHDLAAPDDARTSSRVDAGEFGNKVTVAAVNETVSIETRNRSRRYCRVGSAWIDWTYGTAGDAVPRCDAFDVDMIVDGAVDALDQPRDRDLVSGLDMAWKRES